MEKFSERWFPHPFVSVIMGLSWLMLAHSVSVGNLIIAAILAIFLPRMVRPFIIRTPHINWGLALKLFFVVVKDVIASNLRVAKLMFLPTERLHPKWFRVPLETRHEQVNSILAMIITTTPGTVSAGIDQERGDILVHSLSTENEQEDIQLIKQRYEATLMAIFDVQNQQGEQP